MDKNEKGDIGKQNGEIVSPDTQNFEEQYGREMEKQLGDLPEDFFREEGCIEDEEEIIEEGGTPPPKKKKRRKKHGFLWFCIVVILVIGLVVVANSGICSIDKITVKGNKNYTAAEIVNMSGVKTGDNLFRTRKGKIKDNLKGDSYVREVKIERKLPNELVIRITEREEVAYLPYGKKYIVIDNQGYVLNTVDKNPELTMIGGMTIKTMNKGQLLEVKEDAKLKEAISIIKSMQKNELFFKKIEVEKVIVKAYIYDQLVCKGTPKNIKKAIKNGTLKEIAYKLYKDKVKKGTINIGSGKYCTYSPKVE